MTTRRRFLDPARIDAALTEAASIAKRGRVKIALAGGVALQFYGSDRFTADVGLVADRYPTDVKQRAVLTFGGVRTALSGVPVDFIVRDDQYAGLYDEAVDHARHVPDVPVPVVTLPYLAAMKMAAGRDKDEQRSPLHPLPRTIGRELPRDPRRGRAAPRPLRGGRARRHPANRRVAEADEQPRSPQKAQELAMARQELAVARRETPRFRALDEPARLVVRPLCARASCGVEVPRGWRLCAACFIAEARGGVP